MAAGGGVPGVGMLPDALSRLGGRARRILRDGRPAAFDLHPWEIDPDQAAPGRCAAALALSALIPTWAPWLGKLQRLLARSAGAAWTLSWLQMAVPGSAPKALRHERAVPSRPSAVRLADPGDHRAIARFVAEADGATPFHRLEWLDAGTRATGHRGQVRRRPNGGEIAALLPLHAAHSPLFGRALGLDRLCGSAGGIEVMPMQRPTPSAASELARR